ncbi:MAG TPA: hypothetical protein VIV40_26210 [Kofleriaceae bacterium]
MEDQSQPSKITIRLSPYELRALWRLRTQGLPEGARPRTITQVLVHALLDAATREDDRGGRTAAKKT